VAAWRRCMPARRWLLDATRRRWKRWRRVLAGAPSTGPAWRWPRPTRCSACTVAVRPRWWRARVAARCGRRRGEARLRLVRAQALGRIGRVARAREEALRAAELAAEPGTRARCDELLALLASHAGQFDEAARRLADARAVHARHDDLAGLARVIGAEAGLCRDGGRPREALTLATRRLDLARATPRLDLVALAHHERASLRIALGRWDEARADAESARELFHGLRDPREFTLAGVALARVELAAGRTADARAALERARELLADAAANRPRWARWAWRSPMCVSRRRGRGGAAGGRRGAARLRLARGRSGSVARVCGWRTRCWLWVAGAKPCARRAAPCDRPRPGRATCALWRRSRWAAPCCAWIGSRPARPLRAARPGPARGTRSRTWRVWARRWPAVTRRPRSRSTRCHRRARGVARLGRRAPGGVEPRRPGRADGRGRRTFSVRRGADRGARRRGRARGARR